MSPVPLVQSVIPLLLLYIVGQCKGKFTMFNPRVIFYMHWYPGKLVEVLRPNTWERNRLTIFVKLISFLSKYKTHFKLYSN